MIDDLTWVVETFTQCLPSSLLLALLHADPRQNDLAWFEQCDLGIMFLMACSYTEPIPVILPSIAQYIVAHPLKSDDWNQERQPDIWALAEIVLEGRKANVMSKIG